MLVLSAMYKRLSRRVPEGRRALVDFVCHCLHCFFLGGHFWRCMERVGWFMNDLPSSV